MANMICPWWLGYFLASPVRRLIQDPDTILKPYLTEGMSALDLGCAMGFFSLPMARLVGDSGRVICVDLQERMIQSLLKRAQKAGLSHRIQTRTCTAESLTISDLAESIDFALAFAMVHEVPNPRDLFQEIYQALSPGGHLLFAEPGGHVSAQQFEKSLNLAKEIGLRDPQPIMIRKSHGALLKKSE